MKRENDANFALTDTARMLRPEFVQEPRERRKPATIDERALRHMPHVITYVVGVEPVEHVATDQCQCGQAWPCTAAFR
jgi:hypothetical protein